MAVVSTGTPVGGNAMRKLLITCKKKHALHERIESIGCVDVATGEEVRFSEDAAIEQLEAGLLRLNVRDERGHEAAVEVERREGRKYLTTKPDRFTTDNLLALPDCPSRVVGTPPPYRPVAPARSHGVSCDWKAGR